MLRLYGRRLPVQFGALDSQLDRHDLHCFPSTIPRCASKWRTHFFQFARNRSMSNIFLSRDEIAELTGVRTGRRGKSREDLQIDWLRTSGIPFWTNARGRPIVARAAIEGKQPREELPKKKWQPNVLMAG
ncbi:MULTISPECIES: DUF4224 domain-containing protein [pseudomallei group]|nr:MULTISPECIES: DUF4224 domain-containing protein [pseudomallei group]WNO23844.1 hypothetical protein PhiBTCVTUL1a_35 [Burkholderia phage phiBtTUL1a]